jgi:hypothetical protein
MGAAPAYSADEVSRAERSAHAIRRCEPERLDELTAVHAGARERHEIEIKTARAEQPDERAMTRILLPSLDDRDHRLRNVRATRELALGQSTPQSRRVHQPTGIHIWKSISALYLLRYFRSFAGTPA